MIKIQFICVHTYSLNGFQHLSDRTLRWDINIIITIKTTYREVVFLNLFN